MDSLELLQCFDELVDMLFGVCGRHLDSESCFAFGDDGVAEADDEDAVVEELFGHGDGGGGFSHDDGADRGGGFEDIELGVRLDLLAAVVGDVAEFLGTLGLIHERADRGVGAGGDCDGERVAKECRSTALDDEVDEVLGCGDESSSAASECFAEGACEDIDLGLAVLVDHVVVFVCASSGFAHDAVAVGVVYAEVGAVLVAELSEFGKVRDVAFHGEDAVGDEPDLAGDIGIVLCFFEGGSAGVHIGVSVDRFLDAFLDDGGQTHRVNDARVVECVGDDDVAGLADGWEECFGRVPAGDEGVARFGSHVLGDGLFEGVVRAECAADEADGGGACAVGFECFDASVDDIGVVSESEVVVGAHADAFVL